MVVRLKEGIIPYTAGDGIDISDNHVISVLLRATNNLIHINEDREMYVDLQLDDGIEPSDEFPVGVTTGRILAEDGRPQNGLILNRKTTSGDYARLIYAADGKLYLDPGTGVWQEIGAGGGSCDCNVKLFTLSGAADLTNAQAALDRQKSGKDAIISYNNEIYMFKTYKVVSQTPAVWLSYNHIVRDWLSDGYSETYASAIEINYDPTNSNTVSSISFATYKTTPSAISPDTYYASPFIPTQSYQPASKAYVDQMVSGVYIYQGSVATYSDLANIQNPRVGDVYNVIDTGMNYAWTGTAWDELGGTINYSAGDGIAINNGVISNTKPGATVSAAAPSNPSEGDLWYDTTNDVLKSYDGTSWNECGSTGNVMAFTLSSTSDLTNAQSAYNWYAAGKTPIIIYNNVSYTCQGATQTGPSGIRFINPYNKNTGHVQIYQETLYFTVSSGTVTNVTTGTWTIFADEFIGYNGAIKIFNLPSVNSNLNTMGIMGWHDSGGGVAFNDNGSMWREMKWDDTTSKFTVEYEDPSGTVYLREYEYDSSYVVTAINTSTYSHGGGSGDMLYSDFNFVTATGSTVTLSLSTAITPSANFTVNAPSTIKDGQTYILRVTNGATPYTMTLGTGITNPSSASTTLTASSTDQFVFLAVGGDLELQATGGGTSYGAATSSTAGIVKLGSDTQQSQAANSPSSTSGRTYPVQTNSSGQMVVNVPWTDSGGGGGGSYSAGNGIDITSNVISNTMYPSNQATGSVGDLLMKTASGTEWLTTDGIYTNVKGWDITSATSSTLQAIVQRVEKGTNYNVILKHGTVPTVYVYGNKVTVGSTTTYYFPCVENTKNADSTSGPSTGYTTIYNAAYKIEVTGSTYTGAIVDNRQNVANVIEPTGVPYTGYFTPTQDYHPATKKYVDDAVAGGGGGGGGITNNTTGTTSTVTQVWAGTETEYNNLGTKSASVLYFVIES